MSEPIVVCLGFATMLEDHYIERVRAIDPRIEVVGLPVDPDTDWLTVPPDQPHDEARWPAPRCWSSCTRQRT